MNSCPDATSHGLAVAQVARLGPVDPGLDSCRCLPVAEALEPLVEVGCREDDGHPGMMAISEATVNHG
jgi:hypothetical protein